MVFLFAILIDRFVFFPSAIRNGMETYEKHTQNNGYNAREASIVSHPLTLHGAMRLRPSNFPADFFFCLSSLQ